MAADLLLERRFRAMGCEGQLLVVGPIAAGALDDAVALIEDLESLWSRFRPDSELRRLNQAGSAMGLSSETFDLIGTALEAWRRTDAHFDPTVLDALIASGYDRTIDDVRALAPISDGARRVGAPPDEDEPRRPVPGPVGIEMDPRARSVVLPEGVRLDLGGIGKGRAADMAAEFLRAAGCSGACVNLGGDVRVSGSAAGGDPWVVAIDDPFIDDRDLVVVGLEEGAVATSSRLRRAWSHEGRTAHHLIDPATGHPAARGLAAVTVIAFDTQWAEVWSKAAFVAGPEAGRELLKAAGVAGLLVTDAGELLRTDGFAAFEVAPPAERSKIDETPFTG